MNENGIFFRIELELLIAITLKILLFILFLLRIYILIYINLLKYFTCIFHSFCDIYLLFYIVFLENEINIY